MRGEYSPTVYLISVQEVDTIYNYGPYAMQQEAALNRMAMDNATQDYIETHRPGFQQVEKPQFVFATKNNRFSFSLGGFVSLRAGYDFDGIVDNIDFVTYDIPVHGNYDTRQKLMMDASTSRLFMKAITNTRALGRVVVFMDADFRRGQLHAPPAFGLRVVPGLYAGSRRDDLLRPFGSPDDHRLPGSQRL